MRYIVNLSYDGSAFSGWQIQDNAVSVQGALQNALSTLLGTAITVTGAGRTDTGVNAVNYIAHFDVPDGRTLEPEHFRYKLNAILPRQVAVKEVVRTGPDFHARFDATSREYHYFIHCSKDPFSERFSWWCKYSLDIEKMNRACSHLLGEHDFSCFEKTGGNNATSFCTIFEARWERYTPVHCGMLGFEGGPYLVFTVRANRFLRNMVRAIVGSMVEVGRGRQEPQWIETLIESKDRCAAGESVPGHALFLNKVEY